MTRTKPVVHNLLVLTLGALPIALLVGLLFVAAFPPAWAPQMGRDLSAGDLAGGAAFWYVSLLIPVLIGGIAHQVVLAALPGEWSRDRARMAGLLSSPIILLGLLVPMVLRGGLQGFGWRIVLIALPALAFYAWRMRPVSETQHLERAI